jgi:hypothetical protein
MHISQPGIGDGKRLGQVQASSAACKATTPWFHHDVVGPTTLGEPPARGKRQRQAEHEAHELQEEGHGQMELQHKAAPPLRSDVFQSREEALAPLAMDVMRMTSCTSLNLELEMAHDLAKYKHPTLPNWPKATPHVSKGLDSAQLEPCYLVWILLNWCWALWLGFCSIGTVLLVWILLMVPCSFACRALQRLECMVLFRAGIKKRLTNKETNKF